MKTPKSSTSYKLLMCLLAQKWLQILTDSHQIWNIPSNNESKIKGVGQFYFLNGSFRCYSILSAILLNLKCWSSQR